MGKLNVALQMYTLRDETSKDFVGTLKNVASIGYNAVEFAGYGGLSAKSLRSLLDDLGIRGISTHVGADALRNDLQGVIDYALIVGLEYIVLPWLPKEYITNTDSFSILTDALNQAGEVCAKQGITLCYHNHDFEFAQIEGKYALDLLYAATNPDYVKAELDLYWVKRAGLDPVAYVKQYPGRVPLIHLKDMANDTEKSFAEVGYGVMDMDGIFAAGAEVGTKWYIVEQDVCKRPPLESVRMSFEYLQSRGLV